MHVWRCGGGGMVVWQLCDSGGVTAAWWGSGVVWCGGAAM